jgi:pyruvate dehydrogenase E1 component
MYGGQHQDPNCIYYLTVYNEPYVQPAEPEGVDVEGIIRGIHQISRNDRQGLKAQILASGVAVPWAYEAQQLLQNDWGVSADIWSVTSWSELRRDGLLRDEAKFLNPSYEIPDAYLTAKLKNAPGPFLGVSDYMHAVQDQIRAWIPGDYATLGADGFGFSDTRAAARRFFKIDGPSIVVRVLEQLVERGELDASVPQQAIDKYRLHDVNAGTSGSTGGEN